MKNKITIYTDGSARGNPGPAGWGAVIITNYELQINNKNLIIKEIGGSYKHATNNQMELTAPIKALEYLKLKSDKGDLLQMEIEIFSDSKYLITGISDWIFNWIKNGWKNSAKKPVLNKELWQKLHKLNNEFKVKWTYVEGHAGNKWNEKADEIATNFADSV